MSGKGSPIRVLVCDDHQIVRQGLVALLEADDDFEVVAEAADGGEAIALFRQHAPDVTLIDLRMPRLDGIETIRLLLRSAPDSRFLVLTTYDDDDDISRALQAGASGYLLKDIGRDTLREAIRVVHSGRRFIPANIADRALPRAKAQELTDRELQVLRHIAEGLTNKQIGEQLGIAESTVKSHVNTLLSKLRVTDRTQALVLAVKRGLIQIG
jgi:two-component system NarL family response regulator